MEMKISQKKPLRLYFPNYMSGSIFSAMPNAPWVPDSAQLEMDIAYFTSWSGDKPATAFVERLSTDGVADTQKIADILWKLYGKSWSKLWEAYNLDYTPTDNYNIKEVLARTQDNNRTIGRNVDKSGSVNSTESGTDTTTTTYEDSGTSSNKRDTTEDETTTVNYGKVDTSQGETDHFVYGFNTVEKVPQTVDTDTSTNTQSGSDTTTRNLVGVVTDAGSTTGKGSSTVTETTSGTSASLTGEKTKDDTTDIDKEKEDSTRTREGNIGQTSYQDLIRQELELRKWNFFRQVFADCDKFLCLSIYDQCLISVN